jgi:hypothetical protein
MSRTTTHLGVHNHFVVNGKCWESIKKTRRLIAKEVDHAHDAKIFAITLHAYKTFLARYLLHNSNDDIVELFKGE